MTASAAPPPNPLAAAHLQAQPDRFGLPACTGPDHQILHGTAAVLCYDSTHNDAHYRYSQFPRTVPRWIRIHQKVQQSPHAQDASWLSRR